MIYVTWDVLHRQINIHTGKSKLFREMELRSREGSRHAWASHGCSRAAQERTPRHHGPVRVSNRIFIAIVVLELQHASAERLRCAGRPVCYKVDGRARRGSLCAGWLRQTSYPTTAASGPGEDQVFIMLIIRRMGSTACACEARDDGSYWRALHRFNGCNAPRWRTVTGCA